MSALTEEGHIVFDDIDEFGRIRINDFLEDGTFIPIIIKKIIQTYVTVIIKYVKSTILINRLTERIGIRISHRPFQPPKPIQVVSPVPSRPEDVAGVRFTLRIKPKWEIKIKRNGVTIHHKKRRRDLLVWRGQSVLAYLLSQGAVGTSTSTWKAVASENSTAPDMGDDSGNPEANEFNPLIGSSVSVTYDFQPTIKPSGSYQTYAEIIIEATIVSDGSKTLRKIGIIDNVAIPNRHIIVEDSVTPFSVLLNDEIFIRYVIQLG